MQPLFIISGTYDEYLKWYHENPHEQMAAIYVQNVSTVTRLHIVGEPHGKFIGTWRKRADIMVILSELIKMTYHNGKLIKLYEELRGVESTIKQQKLEELQRIVTDQLMSLHGDKYDRI